MDLGFLNGKLYIFLVFKLVVIMYVVFVIFF